MIAVELKPGIPGARRACLRPLCGTDEVLIQQGAPQETLALLQQLLVDDGEGAVAPKQARDLPVCDVDRLLAELHLRCFGDQIESRTRCRGCGKAFDVSFSLNGLLMTVNELRTQVSAGLAGPDNDGVFLAADGRRFRLPTMRDLEAVAGLPPEAAAQRMRQDCVLEGDPDQDPEVLEEAMAAVGPVLDTDLDAACPHCGKAQKVRFELQSYFAQALAAERRFVNHEVHQLARAYGWQRSEILAMTQEDRRAHVRLVSAEGAAVRRRTTLS